MEHNQKRHSLLKQIFNNYYFKKRYIIIVAILLYFSSFLSQYLFNQQYKEENVTAAIQKSINVKENEFNQLINSKHFKNKLASSTQINCLNEYNNLSFGVFVYVKDSINKLSLIGWNDNKYHVSLNDILESDSNYLVHYENGYFELVRKEFYINKSKYVTIGLVPIKWQYFITNKYLEPKFDGFGDYYIYYNISNSPTRNVIKSNKGNVLTYIVKTQNGKIIDYDWLTIILRILGLLSFFILINSYCIDLVKKKGFKIGFRVFLLLIVVIRLGIYIIPGFPFDETKLKLFDPLIYASNFIHPSLGDILINFILCYWLIQFYKKNSINFKVNNVQILYKKLLFIWGYVATVIISIYLLKSLVVDSKISFDVSNFFSINEYTGIAFVCIGLLFFIFHSFTTVILTNIENKLSTYFIFLVSILAVLFYLFLNAKGIINASLEFYFGIFLWSILFFFFQRKNNFQKRNKSEVSITLSLLWILHYTIIGAFVIFYYNNILELQQRKKVAEKIYLQYDATAENLLKIATSDLDNNFFLKNAHRFKDVESTSFIKDSLVAENFSGYLNKFETSILLFDENSNPVFNSDTASYRDLNFHYNNLQNKLNVDGLTNANTSNNKIAYLFKKNIFDINENLKYKLFVKVKERHDTRVSIFPELFRQWQDEDSYTNYFYATYTNNQLVKQSSNYNFPINYSANIKKYFNENDNKFNVLTYQPNSLSTIVIIKKNQYLIDFITLFAYLFFTFLLLSLFITFINKAIVSQFKVSRFLNSVSFNIQNQIRAVIIFISVFSFLVIGVVTIVFFINRFNQNTEEKLTKTIENISEKINVYGNENIANNNITNFLKHFQSSEKEIVDINYFDTAGNIIFTTQPYIFNKKLVDKKMNPIAFNKIFVDKEVIFKCDEQIGNLNYISLYKPIKDKNDKVVACVNTPYLNSEAELKLEISSVIATLINLNAFIFLIATAIAYLITNRITSSFKIIGDKMKSINWSENSEEIEWENDDEIGVLVKEYNVMVRKLDETAQAFALSQKEMAWKEMAKQVAHEIKNPLTPMKLSIQYLQKNIDDGNPNVKELSKKVSNTLIEQIDQLTIIAQNFSQFANIDNANKIKLDIVKTINGVVSLFEINENNEIKHDISNSNIYILADKTQIGRVFTNLIKNGLEAKRENYFARIAISYEVNNDKVIVTINDNGVGISDDVYSKMFTPNFTTKSSGTGLGLAICKGIVDNTNGKIWFETSDSGTTFFVEFPLY